MHSSSTSVIIHARTHVNAHTPMHTGMHKHARSDTDTDRQTCAHTQTDTDTERQTDRQTDRHARTRTKTRTRTHARTQARTHALPPSLSLSLSLPLPLPLSPPSLSDNGPRNQGMRDANQNQGTRDDDDGNLGASRFRWSSTATGPSEPRETSACESKARRGLGSGPPGDSARARANSGNHDGPEPSRPMSAGLGCAGAIAHQPCDLSQCLKRLAH